MTRLAPEIRAGREPDWPSGGGRIDIVAPLLHTNHILTDELPGNLSGRIHEVSPALGAHDPGGIARTDRGALAVAQERSDRGRKTIPLPFGRGLPPGVAALPECHLGVVDAGSRRVAADAHLAAGPHELINKFLTQRRRD